MNGAKPSVKDHSSPTADAILYLLGSEGILFSRANQRLYYLNTTAACIWCGLEEGLTAAEIAGMLSRQFSIPLATAEQDVHAALNAWASEGLTARTENGGPHALEDYSSTTGDPPRQAEAPPGRTVEIRQVKRRAAVARSGERHRYRAGSTVLAVSYPSKQLESLVHPVFAHLELAGQDIAQENETLVDISKDSAGFRLAINGAQAPVQLSAAEVAPRLNHALLLTAFECSGCLAAFHAGAVDTGSGALLLPGAPGSGKSTLITALLAEGYHYLSDELVLLMADQQVQPLPVSPGLKRGAWELLASKQPGLKDLPVHHQADGTHVRYLTPPASPSPRRDRYRVNALVFPHYAAGAQTSLQRLSSAYALSRLAEAGYALPGTLNPGVVNALVEWIDQQECYALEVGNLGYAISLLDQFRR